MSYIVIMTLAILCASSCCLFTLCLIICRKKRVLCWRRNDVDEEGVASEIDNEEARSMRQRALEDRNKQKLEKLSAKLKKDTYENINSTNKAISCCICFEDFTTGIIVRETPCKHIFHNHCLMEWIKTKIAAPDCPYCRTEIKQ